MQQMVVSCISCVGRAKICGRTVLYTFKKAYIYKRKSSLKEFSGNDIHCHWKTTHKGNGNAVHGFSCRFKKHSRW